MKLSGMDTIDRMKVIKSLRELRGVVDNYNNDVEHSRELLKPEGFDALMMKALESNEAVSGGGQRTITDEEVAKLNRMSEQFNRDMKAFQTGVFCQESKVFKGGIDGEVIEVKLDKLSEETFTKLCDANKEVSGGALAVVYELLVG